MPNFNGFNFNRDGIEEGGLFGKSSPFFKGPSLESIQTNKSFQEMGALGGSPLINGSPFGDESIFAQDDYVQYVNFKKLINAIISYRGKIMPFDYTEFESQKREVYVMQYKTGIGPYRKIIEKYSDEGLPEEGLIEKKEGNSLMDKVKDLLDKIDRELTEKLLTKHTERLNVPYINAKGVTLRFEGLLNTIKGKAKIARGAVGFIFELDALKGVIKFTDNFHYIDKQGNATTKTAFSISAKAYREYSELCKLENLYLPDYSKKSIIAKFAAEANKVKNNPLDVAWLYTVMPDFVYLQMDKSQLISDLTAILKGKVREGYYVNEEAIVLKILSAFVTDAQKDQDLILNALVNTLIENKTLFEILYKKMNDWGGADNWTAAMLLLFKIWSASKFAQEESYQYTDQPETLAYESKKILGFYDSNYRFEFNNKNVEVFMEVAEDYGEKRMIIKKYFTSYEILQPIQLTEFDQQGELKLLNKIPAFYLKAFDDRNTWTDFEKASWLTLDVVTTFTGIGNILKLRHLRHLSKLEGMIVILGSLQVASGVLGIMLNYLDVCKDKEFCDKLRVYLFWFDLASLGTDVILKKMLRKSAKGALDKMQRDLTLDEREIEKHLKKIVNDEKDILDLKTTFGGVPMDVKLLKKIIKAFERQGGTIQINTEASIEYLAYKTKVEGTKVFGVTTDAKTIYLESDPSISTVYEELIHSAQFRTGLYNELVDKYDNNIAVYFMEKDAAEKLLKNATSWKIPDDEIDMIKIRLQIFTNYLKQRGL